MTPRVMFAASAVVTVSLALGALLAWRDPSGAPPPGEAATASGPTTLDGATLFQAKGCAWCHRSATSEPHVEGLPDLTEVGAWGGSRRAGLDAAGYVTESVREPSAFIAPGFRPNGPTTGMPALVVSDAELGAIIDYLVG